MGISDGPWFGSLMTLYFMLQSVVECDLASALQGFRTLGLEVGAAIVGGREPSVRPRVRAEL